MYERPLNVVMASALAIIGGLVAIAFLAVAFIDIDPNSSTYTQAALAMLLAVLFFGFKTLVVLVWNYLSRKKLIFKSKDESSSN